MTTCKKCGAAIIWIKTKDGKNMPCNIQKVPFYEQDGAKEKFVTPAGWVISGVAVTESERARGLATHIGHVPHWATCPAANEFKKIRG